MPTPQSPTPADHDHRLQTENAHWALRLALANKDWERASHLVRCIGVLNREGPHSGQGMESILRRLQ